MARGDKPYLRKSTDRKAQIGPLNERLPPHAQSLFLFPIVFGINLIHFFDGKNNRTGQDRRAAKVQIKKPNIFNCKMFLKEKDGEKTCGARITVDAESQQHLKVGQFWPGRVYARKWYFQEAVDLRQTEDQERDVVEVAREGETTPETPETGGNSCSAPVEETLQA